MKSTLPPEQCSRCGKVIGARAKACLLDGAILCATCDRQSRAKRKSLEKTERWRTRERSFHSKVAGVSHQNADGTDRQRIIKRECRIGEWLMLIREQGHPRDRNAIAVFAACRKQIGYLSADVAGELAPLIDRHGMWAEGQITEITGGAGEKEFVGVNILIRLFKKEGAL